MECTVKDCKNEQRYTTKGLCKHHYQRMWEYGTLEKTRIVGDDESRFWSKVNKTDTCWLWTGTDNGNNYGRFYLDGKQVYAHRYSYELANGKVPEGLHLDHVVKKGCTSTLCVNPGHLEPVTNRENALRGKRVSDKRSKLPLGVSEEKSRFRASIMIGGVPKKLGSFRTAADAHKAYMKELELCR